MIKGTTARSAQVSDAITSGLYWAIKSSFVSYVASTAGGTQSMSAGVDVDDTGTFLFPLRDAALRDATWTLRFSGDVRFSGHFGMLFVAIIDPWLTVSATGEGELSIADVASRGGDGRIAIASLEPAAPLPYAGYLVWPPLTPMLRPEGAELFGGAYPAGAGLDPLKIAIREPNKR